MTRFRENKIAAQNFKKSFITEVVEVHHSNLVQRWAIRSHTSRRNGGTIGQKMDFWRIFEHRSKKVVLASLAAP